MLQNCNFLGENGVWMHPHRYGIAYWLAFVQPSHQCKMAVISVSNSIYCTSHIPLLTTQQMSISWAQTFWTMLPIDMNNTGNQLIHYSNMVRGQTVAYTNCLYF